MKFEYTVLLDIRNYTYIVIYPQYENQTRTEGFISSEVFAYVAGILHSVLAIPWRRHQMETFSALLAICAGNSPVTGEFPAQRPVTRSFYVFFGLSLNKRLSKQSWGWWFETSPHPLWRHCNVATGLL